MQRVSTIALMLALTLGWVMAPGVAGAYSSAVSNLGPLVNGADSDFAPTISPDGNYLFFASDRPNSLGGQDIWVSHKGPDGWEQPINLGAPVNNKMNQGPDSFYIKDGVYTLFLTFCRPMDESYCDIYVSEQAPDGSWTKPRDLGSPINTEYSDANASWDYKNKILYFSSTRPGGNIDEEDSGLPNSPTHYDIYRVKLNDDGTWGEPENLGAPINTNGWEGIAFFHPASETLFFSSTGHNPGRPDADIYYTRETSPGVWEQPKPVDAVNGPGNDMYFSIPAAGDLCYFSSNHHGNGFTNFGLEDIYVIPIDLLLNEIMPEQKPPEKECECECDCPCDSDDCDCPCDCPCDCRGGHDRDRAAAPAKTYGAKLLDDFLATKIFHDPSATPASTPFSFGDFNRQHRTWNFRSDLIRFGELFRPKAKTPEPKLKPGPDPSLRVDDDKNLDAPPEDAAYGG